MTFDGFDVVITPFPFADKAVARRRPTVVLSDWESFGRVAGVALIAMITTGRASTWPFDVALRDFEEAGLLHPCFVRMKLATVDLRRIGPKIGALSRRDSAAVAESLRSFLPLGQAGR